ncbi:hypothetical protein Makalu003_107 [Escherichia phage Ec_Makalu_003]|uniref:Uncharacterized protein n=1 Tax=Escherichia phage Ec_Makalu_003 TaxID=2704944 RepID=A0A6B9SPU3_9CAUD|nr:hypothetical protein Makalu003_107 [Escherichia phage Ec_Makalu_003]
MVWNRFRTRSALIDKAGRGECTTRTKLANWRDFYGVLSMVDYSMLCAGVVLLYWRILFDWLGRRRIL